MSLIDRLFVMKACSNKKKPNKWYDYTNYALLSTELELGFQVVDQIVNLEVYRAYSCCATLMKNLVKYVYFPSF